MKGRQIYYLCISILALLNVAFLYLNETIVTKLAPVIYQTAVARKPKHVSGLNVHVWCNLCLHTTFKLREHPTFPGAPTLRTTIDNSQVSQPYRDFAQRVFGFLHPQVTGYYQFEILNASFVSVEVWLSSSEKWQDSKLIAQSVGSAGGDYSTIRSQSCKMKLVARQKYFIDIYHAKSKSSESHFELVWIQPGNLSRYELINARFLSFYINETDEFSSLRYLHKLPDSITRNKAKQNSPTMNEHFTLKSIPYLESETVSNILPSCQYKPSYLILEKIRVPWSAVYKHWHPVRIYPFIRLKNVSKSRNHELPQKEAEYIVSLYLKSLFLGKQR